MSFHRGRTGQSKTAASESLPKEWLEENDTSLDACSGLADLQNGAVVEARFHGGEEFYEAQVRSANTDGTYSIEYKEHGLIWGEYDNCPRDHIRIKGSTVGGETALILAAENNSVEVLRTLLQAGASTDICRTNGDSALIAATSHNFVDCVRNLIEHGANTEICNCAGDNVYMKAASCGAQASLGVLLELPGALRAAEKKNMAGFSAVEVAARENHAGCLDLLLMVGCSPDHRNNDGESPIMVTARFETHIVCSKRLLGAGCNLEFENTVNGDDVLKLAVRFNNTKLVVLLADGDMAPPARVIPDHRNSNGDTALMLAVAQGSSEAVKTLTHMPGAPLNARNAQGDSALTWAVWYGHGLLVKELLSAGASPNLATVKGETALMFASYRNQVEIMKCLLDCKADPDLANANGDTALALAAGCGNAPKCVELLLGAGVNPNVRDGQGHTPLMLAVGQGNFECASELLKTGLVNTALVTRNDDTLEDFIEGRPDADTWNQLIASFSTVAVAEEVAFPEPSVQLEEVHAEVVSEIDDAMSVSEDAPMLVVEETSSTLLEHYDEATGKWVMMDASTGVAPPTAPEVSDATAVLEAEEVQASFQSSLDADFALALALEQEQQAKTRPTSPPQLPSPSRRGAPARRARPIRGQLVAVNLARLPDGKNFGITITQSPSEGVRILALVHKHDTLEAGDRIVEVNGCAVTGLSVREVAECVRRRRQEKILSLVVEKPRRWGLGRFFSRSEQRNEESLQRHIFGGSYPRTLHLTVIGAIGLPPLYPLSTYPNSYIEVTNRSTASSFRTKVVRNNAFPVWEELVEVVVRSPEDQIVVQLLSEQLDPIDSSQTSTGPSHHGASDGCRKLSQRLRLPHYDKRFCCNREVSLALAPFSHSPMLAAVPMQSTRPLMLRVKAVWEDSKEDRKLKVKQQKKAERRVERRGSRNETGDPRAPTSDSAKGFHETMHLSITGILGLPPVIWKHPKTLAKTFIQLRNTATDQTLKTRSLLEAVMDSKRSELVQMEHGGLSDSISLTDFFVVTMRGAKDKLELVLLCEELPSELDNEDEAGGPSVIGFAALPHYDERIMLGNEVGLRVRLLDSIASQLAPRAAKACVLKLTSTWSDKADDPEFPKCLIVNVIGFSMFEPSDIRAPNLHVQVHNASTGQVNRTRTQRDTSFPVFEEVFHVRVKSSQDSVVLRIMNRGGGHLSEDIQVGSVDLSLNDKVLNNREAALEVLSVELSDGVSSFERKIVGVLQVAAMWESMSVSQR